LRRNNIKGELTMVKVRKLTRQDLIDEIDQLRQQVIELQSEIIRLKQPQDWPIMPNDAPWQPYVYPYYKMPDDTTGDPLPAQPNITICYDTNAGLSIDDEERILSGINDRINNEERVY